MKITNVIFENKQYVKTISKIHGSDQLSVMDAYRINRLVKKLHELFEEYFTLKNGIIKKFGTPDKDKQYLIEEKDRKEFNSEWEDLLNIEHDLETGEELDDAFALGFKRRGTWWKVESLNKPSGMFDVRWETIIRELRELLKSSGLPAWHPPQKTGFFRYIVVRKSFHQDKLLINLVTSSVGIDDFNVDEFTAFIKGKLGSRLAGLQHTVNDNIADRAKIENGQCSLLHGEPVVIERLLGLDFEISMESFFQTNPKSAERLYNKALDYVFEEDLASKDVVMDLFCGTGTIGQLLTSRNADVKIVGVDIVEEAIKDARRNARRNNITGIDFYAADVGKFLKEYPKYVGKIKTVILDPPRAGIAPKTLLKVIALGANNIIYISCNPSTQARDTDTLMKEGYLLDKISFVDQFPHTGHIESIAKYKKA